MNTKPLPSGKSYPHDDCKHTKASVVRLEQKVNVVALKYHTDASLQTSQKKCP